eukprot:m.80015 g.80015  ORF g.80015 m.80015 type:complete len:1019 (-) comp10864_c0_seq1:232-3288(-)
MGSMTPMVPASRGRRPVNCVSNARETRRFGQCYSMTTQWICLMLGTLLSNAQPLEGHSTVAPAAARPSQHHTPPSTSLQPWSTQSSGLSTLLNNSGPNAHPHSAARRGGTLEDPFVQQVALGNVGGTHDRGRRGLGLCASLPSWPISNLGGARCSDVPQSGVTSGLLWTGAASSATSCAMLLNIGVQSVTCETVCRSGLVSPINGAILSCSAAFHVFSAPPEADCPIHPTVPVSSCFIRATTLICVCSLPPTTPPPTHVPSSSPTTKVPTNPPTRAPTRSPTRAPTRAPSVAPSSAAPSTLAPSSLAPTTRSPTSTAPSSVAPTTREPTSASPSTRTPTSVRPTTRTPTSAAPSTRVPTSAAPTTRFPTRSPTSTAPTTQAPISGAPSTRTPTSGAPSSGAPTSAAPSTQTPASLSPTAQPTSVAPSGAPLSLAPSTLSPSTGAPTSRSPTTDVRATGVPSTAAPSSLAPMTRQPTNGQIPTEPPTTVAPSTVSPIAARRPTASPTNAPTAVSTAPSAATGAPTGTGVTSAPASVTLAPSRVTPFITVSPTAAPVSVAPATDAPTSATASPTTATLSPRPRAPTQTTAPVLPVTATPVRSPVVGSPTADPTAAPTVVTQVPTATPSRVPTRLPNTPAVTRTPVLGGPSRAPTRGTTPTTVRFSSTSAPAQLRPASLAPSTLPTALAGTDDVGGGGSGNSTAMIVIVVLVVGICAMFLAFVGVSRRSKAKQSPHRDMPPVHINPSYIRTAEQAPAAAPSAVEQIAGHAAASATHAYETVDEQNAHSSHRQHAPSYAVAHDAPRISAASTFDEPGSGVVRSDSGTYLRFLGSGSTRPGGNKAVGKADLGYLQVLGQDEAGSASGPSVCVNGYLIPLAGSANASTGAYASPAEYDDFGRRVVPNEYADVAIPPATPAYASPTSSDANSGSPATQPLPSAAYSSVDEGVSGRGPQYGQPITAPDAYETPIAVGEEDGVGTAGGSRGYDTPRSLVEAPSGGYAMPAQLSPDFSDVPEPSATTA